MTGTPLQQSRSMAGKVRETLEPAVSPQGRVKLGTLLFDMGRQAQLSDAEFDVFEQLRDKTPLRTARLE